MKDVTYAVVTMPMDLIEMDANSPEVIQLAIRLAGGDPNLWKCYVLCNPVLDGPVRKVVGGEQYKLRLQDNEPFNWPSAFGEVREITLDVIAQALLLIGFPDWLAPEYFIAIRSNGLSIHYEGDGILHPGHKYFLRTV